MDASGDWVSFDWRGRTAQAWLPAPLAERELTVGASGLSDAQRALDAIRVADDLLPPNWEPLARLLLRTEGIASSSIEGVRAPIADVVRAELDPTHGDAGWIADNLAAVEAAITTEELGHERLHAWHTSLMGHSALPAELIGAYRTSPSWIGGTSPRDAAFVPPPALEVEALMEDLFEFANGTPCDPVTQAAIVHAQFETIHPYGDGNGRLGRALVGWVLRRRQVVRRLPPPVSVLIARDAGGYISGLYQFREMSLDAWVHWFAGIVERSATQTETMIREVEALLDRWRSATATLRADAAARRAIETLPQMPVLDAANLADALGTSRRSALAGLRELQELGILTELPARPTGRGRPAVWWQATELLDTARGWTS